MDQRIRIYKVSQLILRSGMFMYQGRDILFHLKSLKTGFKWYFNLFQSYPSLLVLASFCCLFHGIPWDLGGGIVLQTFGNKHSVAIFSTLASVVLE